MEVAQLPVVENFEVFGEGNKRACDGCYISKVRCDGGFPSCPRCKRRGVECIYSEKRRGGSSKRKQDAGSPPFVTAIATFGSPALNNVALPVPPPTVASASVARRSAPSAALAGSSLPSPREMELLEVFVRHLNAFVPLASPTTLRDALNPLPLGCGCGGDGGNGGGCKGGDDDFDFLDNGFGGGGGSKAAATALAECEVQRFHARRAVLWGAVALGALYADEEKMADAASKRARTELKECFDGSSPELVSAYMIQCLYFAHFLDAPKLQRYIGYAHQAARDTADLPGDLAASLAFLSINLCAAGVIDAVGCRIDEPPAPPGAPGPSLKARVLRHISAVLLRLFHSSLPMLCALPRPLAPAPGGRLGTVPLAVCPVAASAAAAIAGRVGNGGGGEISGGSGCGGSSSGGIGGDMETDDDLVAALSVGPVGYSDGGYVYGDNDDDEKLFRVVLQAEKLLVADPTPSDTASIVLTGLRGFFLLRACRDTDAVALTEPLADVIADNPVSLHFPFSWVMGRAVLALLRRLGREVAAERLAAAMSPYVERFSFALRPCSVSKLILTTYSGTAFGARRVVVPARKADGAGCSINRSGGGDVDYNDGGVAAGIIATDSVNMVPPAVVWPFEPLSDVPDGPEDGGGMDGGGGGDGSGVGGDNGSLSDYGDDGGIGGTDDLDVLEEFAAAINFSEG